MKLGLQIVLGMLSIIPLIISILGITQGAGRLLPEDLITANFDSHYRYITGYYISLSLIAWWAIPNIEKHTAILRIICGAIFMGGIGRLLSIFQVGAPSPLAIGFTVLELLLPLLCVWQAKLASPRRQPGN
ncbi:MAG: DUF4345 domain-containing protein [Cyanobacteria bacterium J06643_13]